MTKRSKPWKISELKISEPAEVLIKPDIDISGQISRTRLSAQEILDKRPEELPLESKRETHNLLKELKIITAILLGKKKNKELSKVLDTDKSFTSKQIKELEEKGLVMRQGKGRDVSYEVDKFNVAKFLQSKVVVKWKTKSRNKIEKTNPLIKKEDGKPN